MSHSHHTYTVYSDRDMFHICKNNTHFPAKQFATTKKSITSLSAFITYIKQTILSNYKALAASLTQLSPTLGVSLAYHEYSR